MILVTAANGNQGGLLIPKLLEAGADIRACVRTEASEAQLRAAGVADVVVGDLADPLTMTSAMEGVESVYYVGPTLHPNERTMGFAAVDAARRAGVRAFVFSSVLHAITTDLIQHVIKRDVEEHLLSSGMDFTILQPANYMLAHRLKPAFERGVFRLSWSLERRQSLVALDDVTDVAASVLLNGERHAGATYELAAPGSFTGHDLGEIITAVVGRGIAVEEIDCETFLTELYGDVDRHPYQARLMRAISARYSSHDFVGNANVLTWLLGRPPTTYAKFVRCQYDIHRRRVDAQRAPGV
ncbi:NmrA family NAD(P)-binding protein (plasmid) [Polymorphobacter sp. PAMC 29334]|uniref:SDR family oxidoreductase n=1 Tax=Polymorphobacter sp. PAMC 29334 TaxID=2862331 RepID=UPI001C755846|nr:NmrA family NAD(P)-binding protein [Polymorphobacter sp. PAMC 29334]QYE37115.1 NmrA family NAD(P)-binding protein [Polymorphobacter sp. PAMC 29334]